MKKIYLRTFLFSLLVLCAASFNAAAQNRVVAVKYPYPARYLKLSIENKPVKMAYMDVSPTARANGRTVILFHGKNFNGFYWKETAARLSGEGFRVVVPDQIGWGKSDKPNVHYSFHLLARNNKKLLDALDVKSAVVLGHSIGGMLATRFALMFPDATEKLILENPIGLEDYRTFVPDAPFEDLLKSEQAQTYASLKKYQETYFPVWKPEYEQLVQAQAALLAAPDFAQVAVANALTSLMAYEQPVVYEFKNIKAPTLLIIGQLDRTVLGKNRLPKQQQDKYGQYPELGKRASREISGSKLVEFENVGHIPHAQVFDSFIKTVLEFIK